MARELLESWVVRSASIGTELTRTEIHERFSSLQEALFYYGKIDATISPFVIIYRERENIEAPDREMQEVVDMAKLRFSAIFPG